MFEYKVLREIEKNPSHTQRSLASSLDVSVGKVNYMIAGLVEKGIIKARRLKNDPRKIRWQYILTPKGIREKVRITRSYLRQRLQEYKKLQEEITLLKEEIQS